MNQLAAFLTSPDVAPGTPDREQRMALAGDSNSTPESAGIFRIFRPIADPAPIDAAATPASTGAVPLPPPRPTAAAALSLQARTRVVASH